MNWSGTYFYVWLVPYWSVLIFSLLRSAPVLYKTIIDKSSIITVQIIIHFPSLLISNRILKIIIKNNIQKKAKAVYIIKFPINKTFLVELA
ncbi:hypothetical protein AST01_10205 [Staphylococcus equorum]|nr:hypothetical protein AST01_10205 [Staphylococcus equorum]